MYLKPNNIVSLYVLPGLKSADGDNLSEQHETYFTTEMAPMYTSAYEIRRLAGVFIQEISDDILNQLIHTYSLLAEDLAGCQPDSRWERFAGVWVALKVALVAISNTEDFVLAGEGKVFKQLGDLSISREKGGVTDAGLSKLMNHLECELYKYEHAIRTCMLPLMDCLGLENMDARPYVPHLSELVDKGHSDPNRPIIGRRWKTDPSADLTGNKRIVDFGRKYGINTRR